MDEQFDRKKIETDKITRYLFHFAYLDVIFSIVILLNILK